MRARRIALFALSGALVAGGTGAAIAAVTNDDAGRSEQAIVDDAAERLDVSPEKLREASPRPTTPSSTRRCRTAG
ncbi:MAG TPA: hypothetical protein VG474_01680 [Solirubrobacteraceae bacterium]|nr:hypothetical protein [Solirubrobacteraceae bacterium]